MDVMVSTSSDHSTTTPMPRSPWPPWSRSAAPPSAADSPLLVSSLQQSSTPRENSELALRRATVASGPMEVSQCLERVHHAGQITVHTPRFSSLLAPPLLWLTPPPAPPRGPHHPGEKEDNAPHAAVLLVAAAEHFFSLLFPMLSPIINSIFKTVPWGKGNYMVEQGNVLGNRCECDPGWTQMHVGDSLHFIPCVIPNCKHAVNFFLFSQVLAAFLEEWCQWENGCLYCRYLQLLHI